MNDCVVINPIEICRSIVDDIAVNYIIHTAVQELQKDSEETKHYVYDLEIYNNMLLEKKNEDFKK